MKSAKAASKPPNTTVANVPIPYLGSLSIDICRLILAELEHSGKHGRGGDQQRATNVKDDLALSDADLELKVGCHA